jgi:hypothetical protein
MGMPALPQALAVAASVIAVGSFADVGKRLSKVEREQWRSQMPLPDDCRAYAEPESPLDAPALELHPLGADLDLVVVPCTMGTYQGTQRFFVVKRGDPPKSAQSVALPLYDQRPPKGRRQKRLGSEIAAEVRFDDVEHVLTLFSRARSPGDCGWWAAYVFDGSDPKPREFRVRECPETIAGKPPPPPQKWRNVLPSK